MRRTAKSAKGDLPFSTPEEDLAWLTRAAVQKISGSTEKMPSERELALALAMRRLADPKGVRFRDLKSQERPRLMKPG